MRVVKIFGFAKKIIKTHLNLCLWVIFNKSAIVDAPDFARFDVLGGGAEPDGLIEGRLAGVGKTWSWVEQQQAGNLILIKETLSIKEYSCSFGQKLWHFLATITREKDYMYRNTSQNTKLTFLLFYMCFSHFKEINAKFSILLISIIFSSGYWSERSLLSWKGTPSSLLQSN